MSSITLRYVGTTPGSGFSEWLDADDDAVFLRDGDRARMFYDLPDLDTLDRMFARFCNDYVARDERYLDPKRDAEQFFDHLRGLLCYPSEADDLTICDIDAHIIGDGDGLATRDGHICQRHVEYYGYGTCEDCNLASNDLSSVEDSYVVCQSCCDRNYHWCDDCDTYYHESSDDHIHGRGCECESPKQTFAMHNGGTMLDSEVVADLTLPSGTIDDAGIDAIYWYLRGEAHYEAANIVRLGVLGEAWQTKRGNFTKRLSRELHKQGIASLPPVVLSRVGCLARDHSASTSEWRVSFTRDLNQDPSAFYHESSCWWSEYAAGRCALKSTGGMGMRTFSDGSGYYPHGVTGRAWVSPVRWSERARNYVPTFDTTNPDGYVVYNGYGDLDGYTPARILAHMTGLTYRKIGFEASPMYVNAGGYFVGSEQAIARLSGRYGDGPPHLSLRVTEHSDLYHREQVESTTPAAVAPDYAVMV